MKIILAGLPDDTTEELLHELLKRYVEVSEIDLFPSHIPDGEVAILTVDLTNAEAHWVTRRLSGLYCFDNCL